MVEQKYPALLAFKLSKLPKCPSYLSPIPSVFRDQWAEMVIAIIRPFGRGSHRRRVAWWYTRFSGRNERLNRSPFGFLDRFHAVSEKSDKMVNGFL
jgi:hypothetical protein